MIEVMNVLERASDGRGRSPEFMSTHPDPGNRRQVIEQEIQRMAGSGELPQLTTGRDLR
jgi:predicted Zn-dependent protease